MKVVFFGLLVSLILSQSVYASSVIPFSNPESSYSTLIDYLDSLKESVYLSTYTLTSDGITDKLIDSWIRGLDVKVLIEDKPVGGISNYSLSLLCKLYSYNIPVNLYTGDLRFLHAKYIVGDKTGVLVSSENFGDSGYSKNKPGNRGWGAIVFDQQIANDLLGRFIQDLEQSESFVCEANKTPTKAEHRQTSYMIFADQNVSLLSSPDNSLDSVLVFLESAEKSIYIEQLYIKRFWGEKPSPLVDLLIKKAKTGVDVKILLDSNYYSLEGKDNNLEFVQYINNIMGNSTIEAKLIDLDKTGFKELHNKGVIVDNSSVLISSVNWNENSFRNNREIGIIIEGEVSKYFLDLFERDWGSSNFIPTVGKIIVESTNQIIYIVIFVCGLSAIYYALKHRPKKSRTFLS